MSHTSNPASDIARDPSDCLILITKFVFLRLFPEMGYLDFFFFLIAVSIQAFWLMNFLRVA